MVFVGRQRLADEIGEHGLHLTDYRGTDLRAPAATFTTDLSVAAAADLVLITVKSGATHEVADGLAGLLRPDAVVVSFQNGVHNAEILDSALGGARTLVGRSRSTSSSSARAGSTRVPRVTWRSPPIRG